MVGGNGAWSPLLGFWGTLPCLAAVLAAFCSIWVFMNATSLPCIYPVSQELHLSLIALQSALQMHSHFFCGKTALNDMKQDTLAVVSRERSFA